MNSGNRKANAEKEAALGDDALRASEELLKLGLHNDAVSRAYYAAFHYARAVLLLEGLEPKTHRGLVSLLTERANTAVGVTSEAVSLLARLQTFREIADYDARSKLSRERAESEVNAARTFVAEARGRVRG